VHRTWIAVKICLTENGLEKAKMPQIELCAICSEKMDLTKDYVLISKETASTPRAIAHEKCAKEGYEPVKIERG